MVATNKPLVTVCIPCYNHSQFVGECIQSIITQTYENIELIIIDDGSSDNSVEVIETYIEACERRFVRFKFYTRQNKGLSATLNEALRWAEGKYFSPLASDDAALPEKIALLVDVLEAEHECIAAFGGVLSVNSRGELRKEICDPGVWRFDHVLSGATALFAATNLIRVADLREIGGFYQEGIIEDFPTWLRLIERGGYIKTINCIVAKYRVHAGNTFRRSEEMQACRLKIIDQYKHHPYYAKAISKCYFDYARSLSETSASGTIRALVKARTISLRALAIAVYSVLPSSVRSVLKK